MKKLLLATVLALLGVAGSFAQTAVPTMSFHNGTSQNSWVTRQLGQVSAQGEEDNIDPSIKARIFAAVCPNIKKTAVWTPWVTSAHGVMRGTRAQASSIGALEAFHSVTLLDWTQICVDQNLATSGMLLGNLVPGSPHNGNRVAFTTDVSSTNRPFALADCQWTITSSDTPNSLGFVPTFARYFPEIAIVTAGGTEIMDGSTAQQGVYLSYVGPGAAYIAGNQAGLDAIKNYVTPGFVISCLFELKPGGIVVCRERLDLAFSGTQSTAVLMKSGNGTATLTIQGQANQRYNLVSSTTLGPTANWQPFSSLPVKPGTPVTVTTDQAKMFFMAVQGQ